MGKSGPKGPREVLTERDRIFIKAYLTGGSKTNAAIAAGASEKKARSSGYLMSKKPAVAKAIAAAQAEVQKEHVFDLKAAIVEIDQRIATASTAKQHSAVAKMLELKMKAHGLLVEKFDVRQSGFNVQIIGVRDGKPLEIVLPNGALHGLPIPVAQLSGSSDDGDGLID